MKILVFGSLNIDHDYHLEHIAQAKETTFAQDYSVVPGGKGLNAAIALAKSGVHVYLAGNIGYDGQLLEDTLTKNNVDISLLNHVNEPNGHAIIQIDATGENSIFVYGGSNQTITTAYADQVLSHFSAGDILVLQNEINNLNYIIDKAYAIGMQIALNPSPFNEDILKLPLAKITYYFINEVEAALLSGEEDFDKMLLTLRVKYPNATVILTVGSKGAYYRDKDKLLYQPSFKVDAIDTVGAGDTFMGYFISGLSRNMDIPSCMKLAAKAASITCSRKGAADSIPLISEVSI